MFFLETDNHTYSITGATFHLQTVGECLAGTKVDKVGGVSA